MDDSSTSAEGPECLAPKRKCLDSGRGMFKNTWKLPEGIGSSSKGAKYAFCKYCSSHICIAHGGFNDITRHVSGKAHKQRLHDIHSTPTLTMFASSTQNQSHKVMLAEVMFCKYIAMHNIPFRAADHFTPPGATSLTTSPPPPPPPPPYYYPRSAPLTDLGSVY